MPALDYDERLVSEVQFTCERHHWRVFVRYGEHRYQLGTWLLYADVHLACSASSHRESALQPG